jgi:hypothetical protein
LSVSVMRCVLEEDGGQSNCVIARSASDEAIHTRCDEDGLLRKGSQ